MTVINTNVKALFSQAALSSSQRAQTVAMQQLSTGKRINSSRDDAAGMAIATRMTHQIRSMNQAIRNANDALSMLQTAESATTTINDMLSRMRELAIQAANDTNSNDQRSYLDLEFQQLKKEIVSVSEKVEWNGFPLLNGKAGTPVGEMPVLKVTSEGKYEGKLDYEVKYASRSDLTTDQLITDTGSGNLAKSGTLKVTLGKNDGGDDIVSSAKLTLEDGSVIDLMNSQTKPTLAGAGKTIVFTDSVLTDGKGTFEITATTAYDTVTPTTVDLTLSRDFAKLPSMKQGDLVINGESIPPTTGVDTVSPANGASNNNWASAIARVAAINESSGMTGVTAVVQKNVMTGAAMDVQISGKVSAEGTVTINGYVTGKISSTLNNVRASREEAVRQINKISHLTGVVAVDTGVDAQGITLTAADGRNIEVAFNTKSSAAVFSTLTGLKQGVNVGTFALESKVEQSVVVSSAAAGDITTTGLRAGDYSQNISREITANRASSYSPVAKVVKAKFTDPTAAGSLTLNGQEISGTNLSNLVAKINSQFAGKLSAKNGGGGNIFITAQDPGVDFSYFTDHANVTPTTLVENSVGTNRSLKPGDLVINGVAIPGTLDKTDILSSEMARSSDNGGSAIAIAAAINSKYAETGVKATANAAVMSATSAIESNLPQSGFYSIYVNGTQVVVQLNPDDAPSVRMNRIIAELKKHEGQTGVAASINKVGGLELRTVDGRNLSVWFDPVQTALDKSPQTIRASMFGLATGTPSDKPQTTRLTFSKTASDGKGGTVAIKINNTTIDVKLNKNMTKKEVTEEINTAISAALTPPDANINPDPSLLGITASVLDDTGVGGSGLYCLELTNATSNYGNPFEVSVVSTPETQFTATVETKPVQPGLDTANPGTYFWDTARDENGALVGKINPVASDVLAVKDAEVLASQSGSHVNAKTIYGTVTLTSNKAYTIASGSNGFGPDSSFTQLGFSTGSFGGASDVAMSPPRVGRMTFQVGPSAGNDISFDLADFGKKGPITQLITWDVDQPNLNPGDPIPTPGQDNPIFNGVKLTRSFIGSKDGALEVLSKLDATMDKVNAQRATMGSIMNRLDQVVTNLTNVSMNMSASRSQIEDADYAAASTELAKTQIMQQAATAVLAQANTSQQSVLKLLGG